jgi:ADP-ribosylglycohydrolase
MNTRLSRRAFARTSLAGLLAGPALLRGAGAPATPDLGERIRGLIFGTALGDALGGPIEFQPREAVQRLPDPPKVWRDEEVLDAAARAATAGRLRLRPYAPLRPQPESYGQWNTSSAPGTITDDTRHKLILLHSLRAAEKSSRWPMTTRDFAQAYLDWPASPAVAGVPSYPALAADWLEEYQLAARWVLGERDPAKARPTERLWGGLPTCAGQMALLPLAAVFAGEPEKAYRAAYALAFIDNSWGRDLIAALVAGLAVAQVTPVDPKRPTAAWERIKMTILGTDPHGYGKIRWTPRALERWLNLALKLGREARGRPARLFAAMEKEFEHTIKWEAQVPLVVVFGCLALAEYDPLTSLQLSMEWGHDTDSYAQLLGAFIGALHGPQLFRPEWRDAVAARLRADHQVDLEGDCRLLARLNQVSRERAVVQDL